MARRRPRSSPPQTQVRSGGGLLSGVLSFVSREFESFVASATGAPPAAQGDLGRNLAEDEDEIEEYTDDVDEQEERRRRRRRDRSPPRKRTRHAARSHSRKRSVSPDSPPRKHRTSSRAPKRRRHRSPSESEQDSQSSSSPSRAPSPAASAPLTRALKRRPSITMPGSLFPRSPSMEPDFRPERDQRVRFTSSTFRESLSPSPAPPPPDSSCQSSDVPHSEPAPPRASSFSSSPSTPRRPRTNVLSAVDKFHVGAEDAGPSILLPSPHTSPTVIGTTKYTAAADKGKARAMEEHHEGDTSGVLRVRGKEQELVAAREELDRHQRLLAEDYDDEGETSFLRQAERDRDRDKARIRMLEEEIARLKQELSKRSTTSNNTSTPYPPPPPPPPPPLTLPRKNIITVPSASDDPNLFASARASLKQAPPPIENPIVARRTGVSTLGLAPDKMVAFLNEMKTVRLRKTGSAAGAGAAGGGRSAHANGNATFVAPTPPSRVAQLAPRRSLEGLHQRRPLMNEDAPMAPEEWDALRSRVRAEMDNGGVDVNGKVGEKRKRGVDSGVSRVAGALADETRNAPVKRHSGIRAAVATSSMHSSFTGTSTSTSASSSSASRGLPRRTPVPLSSLSQSAPAQPESQSQEHLLPPSPPPPPPPARLASAWQTSSVTDAPTPSLCSDNESYNEGGRGADIWPAERRAPPDEEDDQVLVTPPIGFGVSGGSGPSRSFFRFKGNGVPVEDVAEDKSMRMGRAMDRSLEGSMDRSMNRSVGPSSDAARRARGTEAPATASTNANVSAKARPLASGIPRPKARRPQQPLSRPRTPQASVPPPPPPQVAHEEQEQERVEAVDEDQPSTFIRTRGAAPRANIAFLGGRAPSSPMPISPRRPRAPRVVSRGSASAGGNRRAGPGYTPAARRVVGVEVERYEYQEMVVEQIQDERHDEGLLPSPPIPERNPSPIATRRSSSRARTAALNQSQSQTQTHSHSQSQNQNQPKQPKPTLKRRLTLDEELRTAVPFLHEDPDDDEVEADDAADAHIDPGDAYMAAVAQQDADEVPQEEEHEEHEEEDLDSGVLVGVGTRSKRRGFLAHGGAGGPPVFMSVGYVEGAEEDEEEEEEGQEAEAGGGEYEDGDGGEYEDGLQDDDYEDDAGGGDDDDDEYLPSPAPRARQRRR